ncbi:hypothetical protein AB3Y40_05345 [Yoonia sp. R2331]|uniref:hypothetical protein n=1 Tax=Yoonia sp. R2331 TaxID=3237238 RepID=UPI0034E3E682
MRWLHLPFAGLICLAAVLGWRTGQPVTETEIIDRYAAKYVATFGAGARLTDCVATAGHGDVRLVVRCQHSDGRQAVYPAGAKGQLLDMAGGPEA